MDGGIMIKSQEEQEEEESENIKVCRCKDVYRFREIDMDEGLDTKYRLNKHIWVQGGEGEVGG